MPLSLTEFNHFYIINKVCGLELHGYYVVMVKGSKIGLDKELAKKIIVYAG